MPRKTQKVTVVAYGEAETYTSRKKAIDFYLEGALSCEGAESERYMDIVSALMSGATYYDSDRRFDDERRIFEGPRA